MYCNCKPVNSVRIGRISRKMCPFYRCFYPSTELHRTPRLRFGEKPPCSRSFDTVFKQVSSTRMNVQGTGQTDTLCPRLFNAAISGPGLAHEQNIRTAPDPPEQPASPHQTANIPRPPVLPYPPGRKLNNNIYFESGLLKSTEAKQKQTHHRDLQYYLNPTESGTV